MRKQSRNIIERFHVHSRSSESPGLAVQADQDSARGYSGLGQAAAGVFTRLGNVQAARANAKAREDFDADVARGSADRTSETGSGTAARTQDDLVDATEGYRRGYFLTEGVNRIHQAKRDIAKEVATLRPGEDIAPILEKHTASLLQQPEFQHPDILKQLQPQLQQMQAGVAEYRQKTELAEIFDSQRENLAVMVRNEIASGNLLTPEGFAQFQSALDTEQFAYLDANETADILSEGMVELFASGEIDPAKAEQFLKSSLPGHDVPLWDRTGANGQNWSEQFKSALAAGSNVRARAQEEQQAAMQADSHFRFTGLAQRGIFTADKINAEADKLGLSGKDRLSFVSKWENENTAGLRHLEAEARAARQHREVLGAINAGHALSMTDSQLSKAAQKEWEGAVSGTRQQRQAVIEKYTRIGVVIPQLQDLLGRTTKNNLGANYDLYKELARLDPVVADRYLSEKNATLFAQHHDNVSRFGMSPQESLNALPTGASKGRRAEVATEISKAANGYLRENAEMPDGSARPWWFRHRLEQEAIRLQLANPDASPAVALATAERRAMGDLIKVNGNWVARGGARKDAVPAIEFFAKEVAKAMTEAGEITPEVAAGVFAAPHRDDPNLFVVVLPGGITAYNPRTGRPATFNPLEIAGAHKAYEDERKANGVRRAQAVNQQLKHAPTPVSWGTSDTLGELSAMADAQAAAVRHAEDKAGAAPLPSFPDFLRGYRTRPAKGH